MFYSILLLSYLLFYIILYLSNYLIITYIIKLSQEYVKNYNIFNKCNLYLLFS